MGGCLNPARENPEEVKQHALEKETTTSSQVSFKTYKTTRNDLAKYYLKFPKINQAYKDLFSGWCKAIDKSVKDGASASEIFNLEGPADKASSALSFAGILLTNDEISDALKIDGISPRGDTEILKFKDLVIAVGEVIMSGEDGLKQFKDEEKYHEVKNGFMIIKEMFNQIDVDGSGEISLEEFTTAFADLSHGDDSGIKEKRMGELDFNRDKEISYPEFCVGLSVWVGFVDTFE